MAVGKGRFARGSLASRKNGSIGKWSRASRARGTEVTGKVEEERMLEFMEITDRLPDGMQRGTFRVCSSLSLSKPAFLVGVFLGLN